MSFQKKKIHADQYTIQQGGASRKVIIFVITILLCFGIVLFAWGSLKPYLQQGAHWIGQSAVSIVSKTAGIEPQKDEK